MQYMKLSKLAKRLSLITVMCLSLTACQTMGSDAEIEQAARAMGYTSRGAACEAFDHIYWSKRDTRLTQEQIVEHNKVYTRLCGNKGKKLNGN